MLSFVTRLAFSLVLATTALAQTYTINTPPSVVVCQPTLLTWQGGVAPYFLVRGPSIILPAGQPSAPPLVDLGKQTGTSVTWTVNLGAGTAVFLNLRDNTGNIAQSGQFTILSGTNTTCVGQDVVTSAGPTTGTIASATGSSAIKASATGSPAVSTSASASKSKSAAVSQYAPIGFAAFAGAAVLTLIA